MERVCIYGLFLLVKMFHIFWEILLAFFAAKKKKTVVVAYITTFTLLSYIHSHKLIMCYIELFIEFTPLSAV